jgi:hypothetical protein
MVDAAGDEPSPGGSDERQVYDERAFALRDRARAARERFDPPTDPPDRERALAFARDGVGEAAAIYIDARMERSWVYFETDAFDALETALNAYLELFAACHGVDRDPDVTVRTAAETLLDTHDAVDTAAVLTGVDA